MTIRVSITHHDAASRHALLAEEFYVDPYGQVSDAPVHVQIVQPGVTATLHLHAGNALVVREQPDDAAAEAA